MNDENFYKTKDQFIASILYAFNQKLINTIYENKVCYFFFDNKEFCEEIINKYFKRDLEINVMDFIDAYKTIKTIIYK